MLVERAFSFQQRFVNRDFFLDVRLPLAHERVESALQTFFQAFFFSRDSAERGFILFFLLASAGFLFHSTCTSLDASCGGISETRFLYLRRDNKQLWLVSAFQQINLNPRFQRGCRHHEVEMRLLRGLRRGLPRSCAHAFRDARCLRRSEMH